MSGSALFLIFCLLIAARDVYTRAISERSDESFVLLFYCAGVTVLSWLIHGLRTSSWRGLLNLTGLSPKTRREILKLGLATLTVYGATVLGIHRLGPVVFGSVDYGAMPVATLFAARVMMKDRVTPRQLWGTVTATVGILIFFSDQFREVLARSDHRLWLAISLLSPLFTAYCSVLQKRQVSDGMPPEVVLLFRFPIPAIAFFSWWSWKGFPFVAQDIPSLLFVTGFGVFLPLWLLCLAFVRKSIGSFAGYLFLIPVLTIGLSWLFLSDQRHVIQQPAVVASACLIVLGCCIFEGVFTLPGKKPA